MQIMLLSMCVSVNYKLCSRTLKCHSATNDWLMKVFIVWFVTVLLAVSCLRILLHENFTVKLMPGM